MISHPSAQNTNIHPLPPLACYSRLQSEQVKFQKKTRSCPAVTTEIFPRTMNVRRVQKTVLSVEQEEGLGARVRRSIGRKELRNLDPFLMLDEFRVSKPAGFPDHPHRGFETVTYLLEGSIAHEDFCGHSGRLKSGDLQWMTAGRGVVHAEMPMSEEPVVGLQLWVNLSRQEKMVEPAYQELKGSDIP
ncbi:pirin, partial [Haplochromis burtoni]